MIYLALSLFCITLLFYVYFNLNKILSKQTMLLFRGIILITVLIIPIYYLNYYLTDIKYIPWLFWIVNYAYFILLNIASYLYIQFVYASSRKKFISIKNSILLMIPFLVVIILVLTSRFTHLMFYVGENNQYEKGVLNILHPIVCLGSIMFVTIKVLFVSFKEPLYRRKQDLRVIATYSLFPFFGGILEYIFGATSYFLCFSLVLGPLILYFNLQRNLIIRDKMTDINEKTTLLRRIEKSIPYKGKAKLFLFMMDINDFKDVNDKYGHVAGDEAIKDIANCILAVTGSTKAFAARYGGDEFFVLYELHSEEEATKFISKIKDKISLCESSQKYHLTISIGYAEYNNNIKTVNDFITAADESLYKLKKQHHNS